MSWQNVESAKRYGGRFKTYREVVDVLQQNGEIQGVTVRNTITGEIEEIACDILVNAAGGWAGKVAALAGLEVGVQPDKGPDIDLAFVMTVPFLRQEGRTLPAAVPADGGGRIAPVGAEQAGSGAPLRGGSLQDRRKPFRALVQNGDGILGRQCAKERYEGGKNHFNRIRFKESVWLSSSRLTAVRGVFQAVNRTRAWDPS